MSSYARPHRSLKQTDEQKRRLIDAGYELFALVAKDFIDLAQTELEHFADAANVFEQWRRNERSRYAIIGALSDPALETVTVIGPAGSS